MKKITHLKSLSFLIAFLSVVSFGFGQSDIIISQYIETSSGTTPKGIEIFNISGADITFSPTNNLQIYQGTNGSACTAIASTNITSGTLLANEVWVIGTTNLTTYAISNGSDLSGTTDYGFAFNGNDALQLYLGGIIQDGFGTCGTNPGVSWLGGGVETRNNNLQILDGLCAGNTAGWSNPSTRFDQIAIGTVMTGFGNAPALCCLNSSTWTSGGWVPSTPTINTSVTLSENYDTTVDGNFSACSLTVDPTFILNIDDGNYVEVENDVIVDGTISVQTQGNFVQNDASGTFTLNGVGTASVFKFTPTKQAWYYYTYWSTPVVGETIAGAFPNTDADRRFSFNAVNYLDQHTVGTTNGIPDDIDDNGDDWTIVAGTNVMTPGVGYAATSSPFGLYPGSDSADFIGAFNTGDISTSISNNPLNTLGSWNLIGNPYPCAIDFVAFQVANSTVVDGVAYFWSQSSPPSNANPGNQNSNFNKNDYATYTVGTGGAAGASGIPPTQYIPSAQGFFIAGLANGSVTFTNAMRMADGTSNSQFFKNSNSKKNSSAIANKLWVNLTSDNGVYNQILVGYVDGATNDNDGLSYDAPRLASDASATLYSIIESSSKKFVIQGKATNSLNEDEIINLGFNTNIDVATLYTLSIAQLQGDFLTNSPVYLKDNLLNKVHDLTVCDYTFTSNVGEFNSRFEIVFNATALSTENAVLDSKSLRVVDLDNNRVQFNVSDNLSIKIVNIYDLLGRQLYNLKGNSSSETYLLTNLNDAIYVAKVELSNGAIITKKAIKK